MSDFFKREEFGNKERELALAEAIFSFHTVAHNHSFRSMDCTTKLIQNLFEKKFSCARTKTEAIIKKVLAAHARSELQNELANISYISAFSDASNHKEIKLFPTLIRYFNSQRRVQVKILDFVSLPGETSEIVSNSLLETLNKNNLTNKLVAYCADNANTNFGGVNRKGDNNIFSEIKNKLPLKILGVGCAAHIVNNAINTAADLLPVDIESIVTKIYGYFYIFTVRTEKLKEFCEEADVTYRKLLG